jgi:hypothetical protein
MGEIADMILDGDMCEGCGEFLGSGDGYLRRCAACEDPDRPMTLKACTICGKQFKTNRARLDHEKDKHGVTK